MGECWSSHDGRDDERHDEGDHAVLRVETLGQDEPVEAADEFALRDNAADEDGDQPSGTASQRSRTSRALPHTKQHGTNRGRAQQIGDQEEVQDVVLLVSDDDGRHIKQRCKMLIKQRQLGEARGQLGSNPNLDRIRHAARQHRNDDDNQHLPPTPHIDQDREEQVSIRVRQVRHHAGQRQRHREWDDDPARQERRLAQRVVIIRSVHALPEAREEQVGRCHGDHERHERLEAFHREGRDVGSRPRACRDGHVEAHGDAHHRQQRDDPDALPHIRGQTGAQPADQKVQVGEEDHHQDGDERVGVWRQHGGQLGHTRQLRGQGDELVEDRDETDVNLHDVAESLRHDVRHGDVLPHCRPGVRAHNCQHQHATHPRERVTDDPPGPCVHPDLREGEKGPRAHSS
ncbi:hypothetical protein ON010_g13476 [Phytophthora cinnamomi]|nr:hypothetical protein ON010_g13476 [Phytophthora cinnamomi]